MMTVAGIGFVEMRLGKVAGVTTAEGDLCACVVLDGVTDDRHLPIQIGQTEAFNLSATLTGVEFARPMSPQFAAGLLHALGGRVRQVRMDRLVPAFGGGKAYGSTVEVESASGVELVDARPSGNHWPAGRLSNPGTSPGYGQGVSRHSRDGFPRRPSLSAPGACEPAGLRKRPTPTCAAAAGRK